MPLEGEWARSDVFRVLRDICSDANLDWPQMAKLYQFDLASLDDPQGVVPITAWHAVFEHIAAVMNDDAAMFDLFNSIETGRFSIYDYLFACAPSLRDACLAWARFTPIRTNAYRLKYDEDETGGYVEWPILEGRGEWRQNVFARVGWATQQIEHALDMNVPPILIELATARPLCTSSFLKKYQGRIKFGATRNRISFPKALLSRPLRRHDAHLYDIILKSATSEVKSFGELESPLSRIANELASNLSSGASTLPLISSKLGMSQRAVQRLLEKEGTSFRQLSEEVRRSAAERYLLGTDLPMKEIAYLLGFSELSTFSRAVKTWFGVSPKKVRDAPRSRPHAMSTTAPGHKQPVKRSNVATAARSTSRQSAAVK
jgi:AraC-like DNA-binding protein